MPSSIGSVQKWKTPSTKGNGFRFGRIKGKDHGYRSGGRTRHLKAGWEIGIGQPTQFACRSRGSRSPFALIDYPKQRRLVAILAASQGRIGSRGWPISNRRGNRGRRSEEHTSEL